eukprot:COSAG02_NODE_198_length_29564_cov_12.279009_30_plen_202_part_01
MTGAAGTSGTSTRAAPGGSYSEYPAACTRAIRYTKSYSILNPDSCPVRIYGIHISESVEFRDCSNRVPFSCPFPLSSSIPTGDSESVIGMSRSTIVPPGGQYRTTIGCASSVSSHMRSLTSCQASRQESFGQVPSESLVRLFTDPGHQACVRQPCFWVVGMLECPANSRKRANSRMLRSADRRRRNARGCDLYSSGTRPSSS